MFNRRIIKYLIEWKSSKHRKPLVIRGARQVGKTSAILLFAEKYFKDLVYINLENIEHLKLFREELSLKDFEDIIQVKFHRKILPKDTLVFIDEIQNSPSLIKLLRFFYEEKPEVCVVCAGSLLEARVEREGFSFPVGRVEFAYLYPLDFFEYLEAKNESELLNFLRNVTFKDKISPGIHQLALKNFSEYTMIGGMPEIVKVYLEKKDIQHLKSVYSSLFTSYCEDVYKYSSLSEAKYLSFVIEKAPLFAGNAITYEKFGSSNFRSREMGKTFNTLEKVMLLYQVQATKSQDSPLIPQRKRPKKLIFLDVGLVNHQMNIQEQFLSPSDLNDFYRGRIAEQVTGQNLLSQFSNFSPQIFYWSREKTEGSAEVDFCFSLGGKNLGIEVKSQTAGRLKSLFSFAKNVKNSYLVRVYGGTLLKEKVKYEDRVFSLASIPFYLIPRIFDHHFLFRD